MIPWLVLAFLASSSQASRPRGIRAEVNYHQLLLLSSVIMDELEQLLILWVWILENIFFRTFWDFVCRLLHCTTLARISDVLTAATRSPSSKSMTTTVIVRWGTQHFLPLSLNRYSVFSIVTMLCFLNCCNVMFSQSLQCSLDLCNGQDGSDEPGTSACPNGKFFCENAGHKALVIPSGRVSLFVQCTVVDKLT